MLNVRELGHTNKKCLEFKDVDLSDLDLFGHCFIIEIFRELGRIRTNI